MKKDKKIMAVYVKTVREAKETREMEIVERDIKADMVTELQAVPGTTLGDLPFLPKSISL